MLCIYYIIKKPPCKPFFENPAGDADKNSAFGSSAALDNFPEICYNEKQFRAKQKGERAAAHHSVKSSGATLPT